MELTVAVGAATTKDERKPVARAARSLRFTIAKRMKAQKYQTFASQKIQIRMDESERMDEI